MPLVLAATRVRPLAVIGVLGVVGCIALVVVLHVVSPEFLPGTRMISDYVLGGHRSLFDAAVLLLLVASGATVAALVRAGLAPAPGWAFGLLAAWCVGTGAIVAFPTCDCRVEPTVSGGLHGIASLVAFVSLPAAALLLAGRWGVDPRHRLPAVLVRLLALASLALFAPMTIGLLSLVLAEPGWWTHVPLGLVQRVLAAAEVGLLVALGWWAHRRPPTATVPRPHAGIRPPR